MPDSSTIPCRVWTYDKIFCRKIVTVTAAPGGGGKSSLEIVRGVAMVTGRPLLEENVGRPLSVWIYNLEDDRDELTRRTSAAMEHYGLTNKDLGGRLFIDSGMERPLCTAVELSGPGQLLEPVYDDLALAIRERGIDHLVIDPFVSSHQLSENDNNKIDMVAKRWAKLAYDCNISIGLVHHTRKTNGEAVTMEASRGAKSLIDAARVGIVLNPIDETLRKEWELKPEQVAFSVDNGKANLAPPEKRKFFLMVGHQLGNGEWVGVATRFTPPDPFDGISTASTLKAQQAVEDAGPWQCRQSNQASEWVGIVIAQALGLDPEDDKMRLGRIIGIWLKSNALKEVRPKDSKGNERPCVAVGKWVNTKN